MSYHQPVLLSECIEGLNIKPDGTYVDVTFGGGGHSKEILKRLTTGKLYAFDQDADAAANTINDNRFMLIKQNFRFARNFLKYYKALPVDGILADLGVSSHQFDTPERGFSTRFDGPLDMRMDTKSPLTAAFILNTYSPDQLKKIFAEYGDLKEAWKLAKTIEEKRAQQEIKTTEDLKNIAMPLAPRGKENKFLAKIYQALRIEVNKETEALEEFLSQCPDIIREGGRLVVISYHSLEDGLVKKLIKKGNTEGELEKDFFGNQQLPFRAINSKPITASEKELTENSRSRSAVLRIAERVTPLKREAA
ncbi:MAG: 16S rRNA (cytosine(1402)-N(4))-methyltransferase RsmH [Bacteroidia bacterium]